MSIYRDHLPPKPPRPTTFLGRLACSFGRHDWIGPERPYRHGRFVTCSRCPLWLTTWFAPTPSVGTFVNRDFRPRGPDCLGGIRCHCAECNVALFRHPMAGEP